MGQNVDNFLYSNFLGRTSQKYHPVCAWALAKTLETLAVTK